MNVDLFLKTLPMMGKGMLGIFFVVFLLIVVVYILNAVTKDNSSKQENNI